MAKGTESWAEFYGYEPKPIDIDLGVTQRTLPNGIGRVTMYKQMPGLYLDIKGNEIADELAELAGFKPRLDRVEAKIQKTIREKTLELRREGEESAARIRAEVIAEEEARARNPFSTSDEKSKSSDKPKEPAIEVIDRNSKGDPRGTKNYVMRHDGGPLWSVMSRQTDEVMIERVEGPAAIRAMFEFQRKANEAIAATAKE